VRSFLGVCDGGTEDAEESTAVGALTPRERQVLDLMAAGRPNPDIAEALSIETKTVKNHVSRIYFELDVDSRARAIVLAREVGLGRRAS
jgi:DNA-binding NarL/FixJ family response regulator